MNLIKFQDTQLNIKYINNEIQMTAEELAKALGCTVEAFRVMIHRNPELNNPEFSEVKVIQSVENGVVKKREKRIFTEQGIYEVTLLSKTKRAAEFRRFVRTMLTKIRKNELVVNNQLPASAEKKLDEIAEKVGARDEQLSELIEWLNNNRNEIAKIKVLEQNQNIIINSLDEIGEKINQIIDHIWEEEEEE